jgi:hypothetical protein
VAAEVREGLAVSKQTMSIFHMEKSNPNKLNEVQVIECYQVEI